MPLSTRAQGGLYAVAAYGAWGVVPVYWKWLGAIPAGEMLAHRVVWSVPLLFAFVLVFGRGRALLAALRAPRVVGLLLASTALIAANWGIFLWAVQTGHLLEASLGYYVNPLVNVALGVALLGERLTRGKAFAVGLAAVSVIFLGVATGRPPFIALTLAGTFAVYGLIRKLASVDALVGLFVETLLGLLPAAGWLAWLSTRGATSFPAPTAGGSLLIAAAGVVTVLPLLAFTAAARRLPLSTLGFFQYLAPTGQLLLGVFAYGEPLSPARLVAFGGIWAAIALFSWASLRARTTP